MVLLIGVLLTFGVAAELWWRVACVLEPADHPVAPRALDRHFGTFAYALAGALSLLRLPLALLPYLIKVLCHLVLRLRYKTAVSGELLEAVGIVGDFANLALTATIVAGVVGPPRPHPLVCALYVPLLAEAVRLACEKGRMLASAAWQILPHRRIARALDAPGVTGRCRRWWERPLARYCRYYALGDEERLRYVLTAIGRRAAGDNDLTAKIASVRRFRIVPPHHSLRAGRVRDVAAGEVFVHRRWTNDPDLLIGQALRRGPWLFDPRQLRRPFRYRSEANRLATLCVLRHARLCPGYAVYQFGHEIKAARHGLFYRAFRHLGWDLEGWVGADGTHDFDSLLRLIEARLGRGAVTPAPCPLWPEVAALADLRRCAVAGEQFSAAEIAARYTFPREYVDNVLLPALAAGEVDPTIRARSAAARQRPTRRRKTSATNARPRAAAIQRS